MSNVSNIEDAVIPRIEEAIIESLSNRGGNWVAPHVMANAACGVTPPNVSVYGVINQMVVAGTIEKSFHTTTDKFGSTVRLPLYRLAPQPW